MNLLRSAQHKLILVMVLTGAFCIVEIVVGLRTRSLALIADSFHYLFDFGSYLVAYTANKLSDRTKVHDRLTFGWARARVLGSFVNGVTLAALGFSIFIQSLQRFVMIEEVTEPMLMLIVGCVGVLLNAVCLAFFHDHGEPHQSPRSARNYRKARSVDTELGTTTAPTASSTGRKSARKHNHGFEALFLHVLGDFAANVGVIAAAAIIWKSTSDKRYYADPALSLAISFLVVGISIPLIRRTGLLLAESTSDVHRHADLLEKLQAVSGIVAVHQMRVWRLNEEQTIAMAHVVLVDHVEWCQIKDDVRRCFGSHGIDLVTIETCNQVQ